MAHGENVTCLALGRKSGRVMVTGGDDKKVNLWAVGRPNCIMSLSGHSSPIASVMFSNAEDQVVAGSLSGAIKIWDLEAAKIVHTLSGHKSSICTLNFHPYVPFVASGSLDTNVKLWDVRRKGCIFTYKGHSGCVNSVRFSPDGRWIASAGEDGVVKIWDLTAGKLLVDLKQHSAPVACVEFHPNELLLASGSSDRTVVFWDLEKFQMASATDGNSSGIRSVCFHPDGLCLYASCADALKVYGWEPSRCYDSLTTGWGRGADITMAKNQLIGASFSQTNVSTYVVDISRVQPVGGPVSVPTPPQTIRRHSYTDTRPPTQSGNKINAKEEPEDGVAATPDDETPAIAEIKDVKRYDEIFRPHKELPHTPPRDIEPFPAPPDDVPPASVPASVASKATGGGDPGATYVEKKPVTRSGSVKEREAAKKVDNAPSSYAAAAGAPSKKPSEPASSALPTDRAESSRKPPPSIRPEHFMSPEPSKEQTEMELLLSVSRGHDAVTQVMKTRLKNLQAIRSMWSPSSVKVAVDAAVSMGDRAIIIDLVNMLLASPQLWTLDICCVLLPKFLELILSGYDSYLVTTTSALVLVLKNFGSIIKSNISAPPSSMVDISREERYEKCRRCYKHLIEIWSTINTNDVGSKLANRMRELRLLMAQFD